jgi:hypothetical protein
MNEIMEEIEANFSAIERHLSRMDLELLPDILKSRSVLIDQLTERLQEDGVTAEMRKQTVERIQDQNFYIQARIMARKDRTARELQTLFNLSQRNATYASIPKGLKELKKNL